MAEYNFNYKLFIQFDGEVKEQTFLLRCMPSGNRRQKIKDLKLEISPQADYMCGRDWAGNKTVTGNIFTPHSTFLAQVSGIAETFADICEEACRISPVYAYSTPLTRAAGGLEKFAQSLDLKGVPPYDACLAICRAVYGYLSYSKGVTEVNTTAEQAFNLQKGVCQDYAHICLAIMRYHNIPCRYAAGIICGEGESHAWVEAECNGYIYGFDPTNNLLVTDGYIKFCNGRDAADCAVSRGVYKGFVTHTQTVSSEVHPSPQ